MYVVTNCWVIDNSQNVTKLFVTSPAWHQQFLINMFVWYAKVSLQRFVDRPSCLHWMSHVSKSCTSLTESHMPSTNFRSTINFSSSTLCSVESPVSHTCDTIANQWPHHDTSKFIYRENIVILVFPCAFFCQILKVLWICRHQLIVTKHWKPVYVCLPWIIESSVEYTSQI